MIVLHAAAPSPPHGAAAASSLAPHAVVATGAATGVAVGPEVIMGHPTFYAMDDIPLDDSVSMAHKALSQVQHVIHREGEGLTDERRHLQLWATTLKVMTVSERAAVRARHHDFDLQVEAINQRDANSKRALADAQVLYTSAEAWASTNVRQEEDLIVHAHQVNQRVWDVEELEGQLLEREERLLEREELDDITLHHELEVLSTHESTLECRLCRP
jgi:hypothetical protein